MTGGEDSCHPLFESASKKVFQVLTKFVADSLDVIGEFLIGSFMRPCIVDS